jgi:ribose 5-phosphate isomerase B
MKIAIASDHAGYRYKEKIKKLLQELGHEVVDFGTHSEDPVDYPDFIRPAALAVARGECQRGIVLGGSGNGEAMVANKVRGIRCALCWNEESARLARLHNDANMISLGERLIPESTALAIVRLFLETPFEGGRHKR